MAIQWLVAIADVPSGALDETLGFGGGVTGTTPGAPSGDYDEYLPLSRDDEDPYLWVLRTHRSAGENPTWHLDLMVDDLPEVAQRALDHGAVIVQEVPDLLTMASQSGQQFCLLPHGNHHRRARPRQWPDGHHSLPDQFCIHIPAAQHDIEAQFWTTLIGWDRLPSTMSEFELLQHPDKKVPLRVLLQRLGGDDERDVRAHLELSSDDRNTESRRHVDLGATVVRTAEHWTTQPDPVGLLYCVTDRTPAES